MPAAEMAQLLRHAAGCDRCLPLLRSAGLSMSLAADAPRTPGSDTVKGERAMWSSSATGTHPEVRSASVADTPTCDSPPPTWRGLLAAPQADDELGRLGGYRILRVLGEGGMGIVFEAEDISLGRRVAIKVLRSAEIDQAQRKRFLQEAQLVASLSSDHIVTVHQVGEEAGCMYIVMELLRGETLDARLRRDRSLPLAEMLRIAREVAEGLSAAHERQLVHRDIKPANIWLETRRPDEPARRVKLLDFGVARPLAVHEHLTMGGQIIGTPAYMSPEQACGMPIDQRSDLFSLGTIMYAMLVGKSPFDRASYLHVLKAVVEEPHAPLTEWVPGVPTHLTQLVDRLLAKDAKARPVSARAVADEIRRIEQSLTSTGMVPPEFSSTTATRPTQFRKRLGWGVWAGAVAILAAAALGLLSQYHHLLELKHSNAIESSVMAALGEHSPSVSQSAAPAKPTSDPPAASAPANEVASSDAAAPPATDLPPIKIGIIHSLSGPMATSERSIVDAFLMAVKEINESGGLLNGREVQAIVRDGKSNEYIFAEQAEDLITNEHVVTLFGCWRSPCRKMVEEVCRRHDHLLVYPTTYEGMEESPYVIYMGGAPNQQIVPATKWAFAFLGKRKFFLIGADGVYSHCAHEIIRDEVAALGGQVVGDGYRPLGDTNFGDLARQVVESGADAVMNTVSGAGNISMFNHLREAGVTSESVPTISFKVTEEDLLNISAMGHDLAGDYAVWSYFQSVNTQDNIDFLDRLRQRYGPARVATDPMAAAYAGMHMWGYAVDECKTDRVSDIRAAMIHQTLNAPEGPVEIEADNHHAWRQALIGRIDDDLQFDIVWSSPKPIVPEPFPASRTRGEWLQFQKKLYQKWGGQWRANAPAKPR
jgi:urea transport system substrate-binding protein